MEERSPQVQRMRQASNRAVRGSDSAAGGAGPGDGRGGGFGAGFGDFDTGNSEAGSGAARRRGLSRWKGPRWVVPVRSLVVVLAMVAAALGVLWIESAGVQNASAQLVTETAGKVAVPPLDASLAESAGTAAAGGATDATGAIGPATGVPGSSQGAAAVGGTDNSEGSTEQTLLVVHIAGAVNHPGVFSLAPGSRVFEAVEAAGGALPSAELAALNLAAPLLDGVQVFIPTQEQAAALPLNPGAPQVPGQSQGAVGSAPSGAQGKLNLNSASAAELETLPGVGPVLAERIITWRTDHGKFATVDALDAVVGIGAKLLAGLRDLVTV